MKEKEYKVKAVSWRFIDKKSEDGFLKFARPSQIESYRKWKGKKIKLSQIPKFIKDEGSVILRKDTIIIYDDYIE